MKNAGGNKGNKSGSPKSDGQELRRDRKSATGMAGSPKKGGHGGKFTWSGDGLYSEAELDYALDSKDPNYQESSVRIAKAKPEA